MPDDRPLPAEVLSPADQESVPFYGHELVAVRLEDGRIAAVLRWLCEGLGLNQQSQLRHIRGRAVLADGLVTVRVQTDGGPQAMPALTLDVLSGWLFTVDERRVRPEAQPDVLRFQRECATVLAEYFAKRPAALAAPSAVVPSMPVQRPATPQIDAPAAVWLAFHKQMVAWIEWQDDVERWRGSIESRLEAHEEVLRLVPELLERLGPQTLTPEHARTVQNAVKRLHEAGGYAYSTVYADLGEHFRVVKYDQIPEARWSEVAEWFRVRIQAAEQRQKPH
jgi:hypothetical protein